MDKEKKFIAWIEKLVKHYAPIMGLTLYKITARKRDSEKYIAMTNRHPYQDNEILFTEKAMLDWEKGILGEQEIIHELCHILTDPLFNKATNRYVGQDDLNEERENLTDRIAIIIGNFTAKK